ncbi:MAG: ASPIC/UnbV domain-containing protein [Planctomycetales bacterium]|nr:ASPIC/UnbV domain-containing protein [Planctomycetales bacterium]
MRTDQNLPADQFRNSDQWSKDPSTGERREDLTTRYSTGGFESEGVQYRHSFSGHERNHLFLNRHGTQFHDVSTLSGLDNVADSRSFACWDFDQDGWLDIALVNANRPLFNLYRNRLGESDARLRGRQMIAVRLVGGNVTARPNRELSNRDGYGARVQATLGSQVMLRELHCGEGFAAQNSPTLYFGLADRTQLDSLSVQWPSGIATKLPALQAGSLVTVYEDVSVSPDNTGYTVAPYGSPPSTSLATHTSGDRPRLQERGWPVGDVPVQAQLRIMTSMATWCEACKRELPQLARLREHFSAEDVQFYGVPVDPLDDAALLTEYRSTYAPAYELLLGVTPDQIAEFQSQLRKSVQTDALPSTLVINSAGEVLGAFLGVPDVSAVAKLLTEPVSR